MASLIDQGSKIDVCKVDVTKRASCGDLLGNTLPCPVSPGYRGKPQLPEEEWADCPSSYLILRQSSIISTCFISLNPAFLARHTRSHPSTLDGAICIQMTPLGFREGAPCLWG